MDDRNGVRWSRREVLVALGLSACAAPRAVSRAPAAPAARREQLLSTALPACESPLGSSASPDFPRVDIHCHVFNAFDLPIEGFIRSLAGGAGIPDALVRKPARLVEENIIRLAEARQGTTGVDLAGASKAVGPLVPVLEKSPVASRVGALVDTVELVTRPRREVAAQIARDYPEVRLFTPALVDFQHWHDGQPPRTSLEEQVLEHEKIALAFACSGGPSFHHYAAYNPLRDVRDAGASLSLVKHAIEKRGFIGVKMYPPTGFLPLNNSRFSDRDARLLGKQLDERLREFYEYCESNDVPIMAHANESNEFGPGFGWRANPWGWGTVLAEYPDLRLNFGHFGHARGVSGNTDFTCSCWSKQIVELMAGKAHVYADISNSELYRDTTYRRSYEQLLLRRFSEFGDVTRRVMYGSDWWMLKFNPEPASRFYPELVNFFSANSALRLHVERFMSRNALEFLGIRTADGAFDDGNKNRARLLAYYKAKAAPVPAWLGPATPS